jgi:arginine utilization protein RocB
MDSTWFATVRALTLALVRVPSVTGTPGEVAFADHLAALLAAQPYFVAHPDHLRLVPVPGDPNGRRNVVALVRGVGAETVVLTGHYDVVSTANYGELEPWACDPDALLPRLRAALAAARPASADALALADLESGTYLPGRGALDMKSGLAVGGAVLHRFAATPHAPGNLLFLASPDEEVDSQGIRGAVAALPALAAEWGLSLVAAINLDAVADSGDGAAGQAAYLGSVGKLLPSVYVVGREAHAGSPFAGVSAALLAAEVTRRVEGNGDLSDDTAGELAPPPVTLAMRDLKAQYDVTTPTSVWCLYNVLTHGWSAAEVLTRMGTLVQEALAEGLAALQARAGQYAERSRRAFPIPTWEPLVLTFSELQTLALERGGPAAHHALAAATDRVASDPTVDLPSASRQLTELLWARSGLVGPAAVVGLASLYYPPVQLDPHRPQAARLAAAVARQIAAVGRDAGLPIGQYRFYPGISDKSFLGSREAAANLAVMAANTPVWAARIAFDYSAIAALDLPVVNIGPWGRDYHQRLERVQMPYSFGVLPELVWRVVQDLLGAV